ncbi:MAG: TerC family protein [Rhizobiales bacterium]|nr:TerC family protein [Hyphomicrobiales bacterium]
MAVLVELGAQLLALASDPAAWAALFTLIVLEVVLGIDNLIFIAIVTNRLPESQRAWGRRFGLTLALVLRLGLLFTVAIIVKLTAPVVTLAGQSFSWRDIILIAGGLFLVWKATREIHERVDPHSMTKTSVASLTMTAAIVQIALLDIIFSIDSIITAVGMTEHFPIMVVAVVVAVVVMLLAARPLSEFINGNPTIVMLALGFLLMIGMVLIADGFGVHVPKGYIYTAMAFSAMVEALNLMARNARRAGTTSARGETGEER